MLTGQLRPDAGSISVLGMTMPEQTVDIQARIGVCFEEKNVYENMSGRENLDFFARLYGIKHKDFDPFLRNVGLIDRADDRVSTYSKGMRQRLMMTRAMINDPEILFLDEPTDGLDPVSARAVRAVIKSEAERGAAVILTTHDMNEADQLSDRVAFINEGRIAALDTPENLKLKHGQRSVRIRSRSDGGVEEQVIALDDTGASDQIRQAVDVEGLMTIHTEEATLENIFIELTGRGLDA
jgi:ABC-2 type transport system ATP-binding protein